MYRGETQPTGRLEERNSGQKVACVKLRAAEKLFDNDSGQEFELLSLEP